MELWKVHKICERASLAELRSIQARLTEEMLQGKLDGTNAPIALELVQKYVRIKEVFGD